MKTLILTAAVSLLTASLTFANEAQPQETPRCILKTDAYKPIVPVPFTPACENDVIENDLMAYEVGQAGETDSEDEGSDMPGEVSGGFLVNVGFDGGVEDSEEETSDQPVSVSGAFLVEIAPVDELAGPQFA